FSLQNTGTYVETGLRVRAGSYEARNAKNEYRPADSGHNERPVSSTLPRRRRQDAIYKNDAGDICWIVRNVISHIKPRNGVTHQNEWTGDFGLVQKFMEFTGDAVSIACPRAGFAPAKSGPVV
ncbi:MAG TPA: hypothetical protein VGE93_18630, partial [Bryobacteraceae bacterium]